MAPGYWGLPSSTIDWCEENYAVSHFIAEFWNTVSNVSMILPPLVTVFLLIKQNFEPRLIACHISLLSVGFGSWCFHMTLLYSMQLLDELPMIWGSAFLIYAIVMVEEPPNKSNIPLQIALFTYCSIVTIVYICSNVPVFFQIAYAIMVLCMVFSCARLIRGLHTCNKNIFIAGVFSYGMGFFLWNIDNSFCTSLRSIREVTGPLSPIFELHAWWHLLAGLGTYLGLIFVADTRCTVLGIKSSIKYWLKVWPYVSLE
ncbi:Alkaline ceramidase 3 [Mactra antiquata]